MNALDAACEQVDYLLDRVTYARVEKRFGFGAVTRHDLREFSGEFRSAGADHTLYLANVHNRHNACLYRRFHPRAAGKIDHVIKIFVVEEKLADKMRRAEVFLHLHVLYLRLDAVAVGMSLGITRGGNIETSEIGDVPYQIGRMKILRINVRALDEIAPERENIFSKNAKRLLGI